MENENERDAKTAVAADKRREARTPRRSVLVMPYGENLELNFVSAELTDCSPHGIGIVLNDPLARGAHFLLKLNYRGRTLLVLYEVRHCRAAAGDRYQIGAEYTGEICGPDEPAELGAGFEALSST